MSFVFQRYLKSQTKIGVFQNLRVRGDCGGIKYVMLHLGSWRFTFTWKEKRRQYPSVAICGYMRG
jgi:hypothetical protein